MQANDIDTNRETYESIMNSISTMKATFERMIEATELEDKRFRLKLENKHHSAGG